LLFASSAVLPPAQAEGAAAAAACRSRRPSHHGGFFSLAFRQLCAPTACSGRGRGGGGAQVEEAVALQAILGPDFEARGLGEVTAEAGEALLAAGPAAGGLRWRILVRPDLPAGGLALQARARAGRERCCPCRVPAQPPLLKCCHRRM